MPDSKLHSSRPENENSARRVAGGIRMLSSPRVV